MNYHAHMILATADQPALREGQTYLQSFDAEGQLFVPRIYGAEGNAVKLHWDHARANDIATDQDLYVRLIGMEGAMIGHIRFAVYRSFEAFMAEVERTGFFNHLNVVEHALYNRIGHSLSVDTMLKRYDM
jgi:hypothetical protein